MKVVRVVRVVGSVAPGGSTTCGAWADTALECTGCLLARVRRGKIRPYVAIRLAPCVMHRPPCTTRLGQPSTVHLRRTRVLPLLLSPLDVRRWRAGLLVLRDATAVPPLGILRVVGEIWGLLLLLALAVVAGLRMAVRLDAAISMSSVSSAGLAGGGDVLSFFDAAAVLWAGGVVVARVVGEGLDADTGAAPGGGGMGCCMGVPAVLGVIAAAPGGVTMVGTG